MSIVTLDYQGHAIAIRDDGWFNATQAAAKWGRRPVDWLALQSTKEYIAALQRHYPEVRNPHITKKGTGGGTWMHPKLAVAFARWLDVDFSVWADSAVDGQIRSKTECKNSRHAVKGTNKATMLMVQEIRRTAGKETAAHHYMNENKLINSMLTGEFKGIDRDALSKTDLDLLAYLETRNTVLLGRGFSYEARKETLKSYAMDWRSAHGLADLAIGKAKAEAV